MFDGPPVDIVREACSITGLHQGMNYILLFENLAYIRGFLGSPLCCVNASASVYLLLMLYQRNCFHYYLVLLYLYDFNSDIFILKESSALNKIKFKKCLFKVSQISHTLKNVFYFATLAILRIHHP